MRKTLAEEFSAIHVFNLRGNTRNSGETARREGGQIFGSGSRATVSITILVRNPARTGAAAIHYTDIGDYLPRDRKLSRIAEVGSLGGLTPAVITANEHGDWLNQRADDFDAFLPIERVFALQSGGNAT